MLREYQKLIDRIQIGLNGLIVAFSFAALYWLTVHQVIPHKPFYQYFNALSLISLLDMIILSARGFSLSSRIISRSTVVKHLLIGDFAAVAAFIFLSYLLWLPNPGRVFLLGGIS